MAPLSDEDYRRGRPGAQDLSARGPVGGASEGRARRDRHLAASRPRRPRARSSGCKYEAAKKVLDGAELLVLSDRTAFEGERPWLDPHLALAAIDRALREYRVEAGEENLRRRTSIVLRSGAIRNVHDVCMALGLGADGVCPYVMIEVICVDDYESDISNLCSALRKGIEKVISTLGIHEVRGYARLFSAIGLQAGAGRDLRHARLLRLRRRPAPASPSSTPSPRVRQRILAGAGGRQAGEDVPLLPEGLQGRDRGRERQRDASRSTPRRCASSSASSRSRCATSWTCSPTASRSTPRRSTPASATTPTRS